ncbi:MAG: VanZ family protein [Spirochaetaceae bacterium]|nr:VanZ family protein [Spirochaetaceae bacterium]
MKRILIKLPAIFILLGIWVLSSQRVLPQPKGILGFDKVQHLLAYLVLTLAFGGWTSRKSWKTRTLLTALGVMGAASVYGAVDEAHQFFVPGRDCNVWDWLADTLGGVVGSAMLVLANRRLLVKSEPLGKLFEVTADKYRSVPGNNTPNGQPHGKQKG